MKRYLSIPVLLSGFLFLVSSCFPVKYISIEVLKPAKITLPSEIRSVSLISAKNEQNTPKGYLKDINNIYMDQNFNYHLLSWDYLYGLQDALINSPRLDRVVVSSVDLFDFYRVNGYDWINLVKITRADSTDAIIVVEDYHMLDSISYSEYLGACFIGFKLSSFLDWTVIYPGLLQVVGSDTMKRSYTWERNGYNCEEALAGFPEGWDMLREAAYKTGEDLAKVIAPVWKGNETRSYYVSGNNQIKSGSYEAGQDNWEKAAGYWKTAVQSSNKKTASKAAYNLALAYEMLGDIDMAAEMIHLSDSLYSTSNSRMYQKKLHERLQEKNLLDDQMNVNESVE